MNNPQLHRTNSCIRALNEKTVYQYSNKCIRQITFFIFSLRIHKSAVFSQRSLMHSNSVRFRCWSFIPLFTKSYQKNTPPVKLNLKDQERALAYANDARINSRNKGWGFMGRDLNSGWNWHPRNQGWSLSSTISTSSPSGEVPLMTSPFSSSFSLKALLNSYRWRCRSEMLEIPYAVWARESFFISHG